MSKRFRRAVVIGKFYPPHRGHKMLIDTAFSQSHQLTVIVCAKPTDSIDGELRGQWIREIHPGVDVLVIDDRYDENDTQVWAQNTLRWLGGKPDAVFTSESYGEPYAHAMECIHIPVDNERQRVPCSGTLIRQNPFKQWQYLEPPVRGWLARRVCVVGAESTGTTTLAKMLADRLSTNCVAEYGREYSAEKFARSEHQWTSAEFVHIAREQNRRESLAARNSNRILICDTNSFATCLWHRRYVGNDSAEVEQVAAEAHCDLYLLTGDEIPFVQDGLRDGEHIRHEMHRWFEERLADQTVPWQLVTGTPAERLEVSLQRIRSEMPEALLSIVT